MNPKMYAAAVDALAAAMRRNQTTVVFNDRIIDLQKLECWPLWLEAKRKWESAQRFRQLWKTFRPSEYQMRKENFILQQAFVQDYFLRKVEKDLE